MEGSEPNSLNHNRHSHWVINITLLLAVIAGGWIYANRQLDVQTAVDIDQLSYLLDQRVGHDVALDAFETRLFSAGRSIKRAYRPIADKTADPIWLLAVQTVNDRHAHHPPEYCYTGSGWQISESGSTSWTLPDGSHPSQAIAGIQQAGRTYRELVVYWFTDGEHIVDSYFARVAMETWQKISGNPRSWIMLRVSMPLTDKSPDDKQITALANFSIQVEKAVRLAGPG